MSRERELLQSVMEESWDFLYAGTHTEIKELLAQPEQTEQEPVAWMNDSGGCFLSDGNKYSENWIALYTAPQKRKHLTGIEISQGFQTDDDATHPYSYWSGVDFAEKAHGIGVDDE